MPVCSPVEPRTNPVKMLGAIHWGMGVARGSNELCDQVNQRRLRAGLVSYSASHAHSLKSKGRQTFSEGQGVGLKPLAAFLPQGLIRRDLLTQRGKGSEDGTSPLRILLRRTCHWALRSPSHLARTPLSPPFALSRA